MDIREAMLSEALAAEEIREIVEKEIKTAEAELEKIKIKREKEKEAYDRLYRLLTERLNKKATPGRKAENPLILAGEEWNAFVDRIDHWLTKAQIKEITYETFAEKVKNTPLPRFLQ